MIEHEPYRIADPDGLETPAMVVFEDLVDQNLAALCEQVGGAANLMMHVKTHKAEAIVRKQLAAGVAGFKCATLKELEMVLDAGAPEAVLAYPLVQSIKTRRFAGITADHPEQRVYATVSAPIHVSRLAEAGQAREQRLRVMVDVDAGMRRTGVAPKGVPDLYAAIHGEEWLEAAGLHIYDGHEHFQDPSGREAAAMAHVRDLQALKEQLEAAGMPVERVVGGGSYSYEYYARTEGFHGSPGTVTYWDINGALGKPGQPFRWAALVLCQVVDRYPDQLTITTDAGNKAVAADPALERRAWLLGHKDARLLLQNEEHAVFELPEGRLPEIGDYLLAVPGHVCPTAIRFPGCYVIDAEGAVVDYYPHTARDRL